MHFINQREEILKWAPQQRGFSEVILLRDDAYLGPLLLGSECQPDMSCISTVWLSLTLNRQNLLILVIQYS